MKRITEDTIVAYDRVGNKIKAECMEKWAYNQLEAAPYMYEALKEALDFFVKYDTHNKVISGLSLQLNEALTKAGEKR